MTVLERGEPGAFKNFEAPRFNFLPTFNLPAAGRPLQ
jgi:hypothetical protein